MAIEDTRAKIVSSIWMAIAQSGVDLQPVPPEQQAKLVEAIANSTMLVFDKFLDEMPKPQAEAEPETGEEKVLWQGRPFLSLVENYTITSERIKITRGMLGKDRENFELIRVQDIDLTQGVGERVLNVGDIHITGQDPSNPKIILRNVPKPEEVYELLRKAWLEARKRYGLQFREYM